MAAVKPTTQREQIATLWDKVIGNGKSGMVDDIAVMKGDLLYIRGKVDGHVLTAKPSTKTITIRRIVETAVTVLVLAVVIGGVLLLVLGKLTPDDIANILRAWKGT